MASHEPIHLVIGASGFLGGIVTQTLLRAGKHVRALDIACEVSAILGNNYPIPDNLEVVECSVFDHAGLKVAMQGVETVHMFVSFSVPSTQPRIMSNEIDMTLRAIDLVLQTMFESAVERIIFPSSGGTIYGNIAPVPVREDHAVCPMSSYGMGKLISEQMIQFYSRIHGLNYLIIRISNPYGVKHLRRVSQGVIDVFLQKTKRGEPLQIWGNLDTVRDFLFVDDFSEAYRLLLNSKLERVIVNVGSGQPTSLHDILDGITSAIGYTPKYESIDGIYKGPSYNVLDISKLQSIIDWSPNHNLFDGISLTWKRLHEL